MATLFQRAHEIVQAKANKALDSAEKPDEMLDLSYEQMLDQITQVRRALVDIAASRKQLELQEQQLQHSVDHLQDQAKAALTQGKDDLAKEALSRKAAAQAQIDSMEPQHQQLTEQEEKLEKTLAALQQRVNQFRTQKEVLKAQYSAAKAVSSVDENVGGISKTFGDSGEALQRAQDKIASMQAHAGAVDELLQSGVLEDVGGSTDDIQQELDKAGGRRGGQRAGGHEGGDRRRRLDAGGRLGLLIVVASGGEPQLAEEGRRVRAAGSGPASRSGWGAPTPASPPAGRPGDPPRRGDWRRRCGRRPCRRRPPLRAAAGRPSASSRRAPRRALRRRDSPAPAVGPFHQVGDPDAENELPLFFGSEEAVGETRGVERLPEAVAGPGEVRPVGRRPQPRIDPAEEKAEAARRRRRRRSARRPPQPVPSSSHEQRTLPSGTNRPGAAGSRAVGSVHGERLPPTRSRSTSRRCTRSRRRGCPSSRPASPSGSATRPLRCPRCSTAWSTRATSGGPAGWSS